MPDQRAYQKLRNKYGADGVFVSLYDKVLRTRMFTHAHTHTRTHARTHAHACMHACMTSCIHT